MTTREVKVTLTPAMAKWAAMAISHRIADPDAPDTIAQKRSMAAALKRIRSATHKAVSHTYCYQCGIDGATCKICTAGIDCHCGCDNPKCASHDIKES